MAENENGVDEENFSMDQAEIDSLLRGTDGEDDDSEPLSIGLRSVLDSALVAYERLPMLEVVFDRLARMMTTSLRNFTSDNVEVAINGVSSIRFGAYLDLIPLPTLIGVFKAEEWDNYGLIYADGKLIYSIIESLLGGRKVNTEIDIGGRAFTMIESSLVETLFRLVLSDLSNAFRPLTPVEFKYERHETNPRFVRIVQPGNAAVMAKMDVKIDERGGTLELLFPYATIEPVRELLLQMFMGEKFGQDNIWETHLSSELWHTEVDIAVVLDEQFVSLHDLVNLKPGAQILLNATSSTPVELRCGDVAMFSGFVGHKGNRVAVRIEDRLGGDQEEAA